MRNQELMSEPSLGVSKENENQKPKLSLGQNYLMARKGTIA